MKNLLTTAALIATAGLANAADLSLNSPMNGATLSDGRVDMSVYFTNVDDGMEVVATYVHQNELDDAARFTMLLSDGDVVSFGLPGVSGKIYTFARNADVLNVQADNAWTRLSSK